MYYAPVGSQVLILAGPQRGLVGTMTHDDPSQYSCYTVRVPGELPHYYSPDEIDQWVSPIHEISGEYCITCDEHVSWLREHSAWPVVFVTPIYDALREEEIRSYGITRRVFTF